MNWDKIEQLLGIADKARHWPNLKRIHDTAMNELMEHAQEKVEKPDEPEPDGKLKRRTIDG